MQKKKIKTSTVIPAASALVAKLMSKFFPEPIFLFNKMRYFSVHARPEGFPPEYHRIYLWISNN